MEVFDFKTKICKNIFKGSKCMFVSKFLIAPSPPAKQQSCQHLYLHLRGTQAHGVLCQSG
jgi:hypothetical protein